MERKILGLTLRDRKRAVWIREQTGITDILVDIKWKKWSWAGHVMRRMDNRWTIRVTEWIPREGKRSRGRQKVRWDDEVRKFAGASWNTLAQDRGNWRSQFSLVVSRKFPGFCYHSRFAPPGSCQNMPRM